MLLVSIIGPWTPLGAGGGGFAHPRSLYSRSRLLQVLNPLLQVTIFTSTESGAGTNANVYVQLYGSEGKGEVVYLDNKSDNFENGKWWKSFSGSGS